MNAQGVEAANMALSAVRARREDRPLTPYKPGAWLMALTTFDLLHRYPNVYTSLHFGFSTNIPPLMNTFMPPNNPSIRANQNIFDKIINKEFAKGRYIGPYSKAEIEDAIGHFQTSPLSLVPKPGKPGKFRLVQNLSFPHRPNLSTPSINSFVDPDHYPSSYSTFPIVCLLISTLPQGAQGAVRDVAEAYRTIPLHPSQWHALVVRLQDDSFAVDTAFCFGFTASGGIYGSIGGAGTDIMRAHGIGPILRWVDDHLFIRIPRSAIPDFNTNRANTANRIAHLGGPRVQGGRSWFAGGPLPDGSTEEHDEDYRFPLVDFANSSPRPSEDTDFTYNMSDIDNISQELGIPWETSKDIPFSSTPLFIGFIWDLDRCTVQLSEPKRMKYITAIDNWSLSRTHVLEDVQKLHGKLVHAALIFPEGKPYLTSLERMLGIFGDEPFKLRTPP